MIYKISTCCIFLFVFLCCQEKKREQHIAAEEANLKTCQNSSIDIYNTYTPVYSKYIDPCEDKRNYDTVSDPEHKRMCILLDTINCILSQRDQYGSWPVPEEARSFEVLTDKIDSLLCIFLNNKHSLRIELGRHFEVKESPDHLLRLIRYGSANIEGTGELYKNFIQVINDGMPVAKLWDEMYYTHIDTVINDHKTIYLFSSNTKWMTWWMLFRMNAFLKEGGELKPFKTAFFNKSDELAIDYSCANGDEAIDKNGELKKFSEYSGEKREIIIGFNRARIDKTDTLSAYLFNLEEEDNWKKIGDINIKLKFNGMYFEVKQ